MKRILTILFLLYGTSGFSQNQEMMDRIDSLCLVVKEDSAAKQNEFTTTKYLTGYYPIVKKYTIKSKGNFITYISCEYYKAKKEEPLEYAFGYSETFYLYWGTVLYFSIDEEFLELDTTISDINKRMENGVETQPWELYCWAYKGELVYYMSNGHGLTEMDDFDPKEYYTNLLAGHKKNIRLKFPDLK